MPDRVVLDANVWVSGFIFGGGSPERIVELAESSQILALTSEPIIDQVRRASIKLKVSNRTTLTILERIRRMSEMVADTLEIDTVKEKPSDNRVLECAVAGNADVIVTGDKKHLLSLIEFEGIPLVNPRTFLDRFIAVEAELDEQ